MNVNFKPSTVAFSNANGLMRLSRGRYRWRRNDCFDSSFSRNWRISCSRKWKRSPEPWTSVQPSLDDIGYPFS